MSKYTRWFKLNEKPVRDGEYEGKTIVGGLRTRIFWRHLQDTDKPGFYFWKGVLGPFNCWESAEGQINTWRGLAQKPSENKQ